MSTILTGSEALLDWAVATQPLAGQVVSGDLHLVQPFADGVLVAVVDGLGHGEEAALAARAAVAELAGRADQSVLTLLQHCHHVLHGLRGVVMSLASFNARKSILTWAGVGNVEGFLMRAQAGADRKYLLLRGGTIGYQLPPLRASQLPVQPGDTLIFITDGIHGGFDKTLVVGNTPVQAAERILQQFAKNTDDALVLVARWRWLAAVGTLP